MGQELPALIRDGYTSFKVYMTYDLLAARRRADARHPGGGAARGRARHGPCREPRHDQMADRPAAGARSRGAALPRRQPCPPRRGRGDQPGRHAVATARRADPAGSRLGRRGDRGHPQRPDQGPQDLRRDLPAISVSDRRRHRQARHGGRQILLQPAAARPRGAGGGVDRFAQRHLPGVLVRSRALPLRRFRQAAEGRQDHLQGNRQWRARDRAAAAVAVFRRRRTGTPRPQRLCRIDRDQPRQALRALPEEGHDRSRQRCRYRDLGPRARDHGHRRDIARQCRLHPL